MRPALQSRPWLFVLLAISFVCPVSTIAGSLPERENLGPSQVRHFLKDQVPSAGQKTSRFSWFRKAASGKVIGPAPQRTRASNPESPRIKSSKARLPGTFLAKYGGDVVLRFNVSTPQEEAALSEAADTLFLDVWEFTDNWADIHLPEDDLPSLLGLLPESLHNAYSNLMPDLARTIYRTYPSMAFATPQFPDSKIEPAFTPALKKDGGVDNIFFRDYQPFSVIVPWMRLMASMFTTHVRMFNIGISYEGREIPALRVGVHPTNSQTKDPEPRKTIIVLGGSHAREWISVSTVNYIAWSLIASYGKSPGITKLLSEFDFVFIPTLNPDGYVYTWENDRLWRKNRQQTNFRLCRGLDLDRGFGFEWDGTSFQSNPCSESYPGDEPFQAVESHRLAEWAKNETEHNNVKFVGFLDLHAYSQQVLYPFSYSCVASPPSLENLEELGMGLAKAIRISSGEYYTVASACEGSVGSTSRESRSSKKSKTSTSNKNARNSKSRNGKAARIETGGGAAIDWFYHSMNVKYSFQIKLRDTGSYGFLLPSENIVPTGEEAYNAVKFFADYLSGNKGIEKVMPESGEEVEVEKQIADSGEGETEFEGGEEANETTVEEGPRAEDAVEMVPELRRSR